MSDTETNEERKDRLIADIGTLQNAMAGMTETFALMGTGLARLELHLFTLMKYMHDNEVIDLEDLPLYHHVFNAHKDLREFFGCDVEEFLSTHEIEGDDEEEPDEGAASDG